jgi:hypothetical protein
MHDVARVKIYANELFAGKERRVCTRATSNIENSISVLK